MLQKVDEKNSAKKRRKTRERREIHNAIEILSVIQLRERESEGKCVFTLTIFKKHTNRAENGVLAVSEKEVTSIRATAAIIS